MVGLLSEDRVTIGGVMDLAPDGSSHDVRRSLVLLTDTPAPGVRPGLAGTTA